MELKRQMLNRLCYTDLVYERINKKLQSNRTRAEIEQLVSELISAEDNLIEKRGKNYYLHDFKQLLRITVNANNFRIITMDKIKR